MSRSLCLRCMTSNRVCYCNHIQTVRSSVRFVILQHPLERKRSVGTARIAHRCVENSVLRVGTGEDFDQDPVIQSILGNPGFHCVVLYPGPAATNISLHPDGAWLPQGKKLVVFVIDGTWACAKTMLKRGRNDSDASSDFF